ncbi:NADH-quinone oxidoreductase subunit NuoF [Vulgatibacter incomptus]|uniref:NADH-quinone oxidoreductase subunit F n=1 Tax=Vulgatibacter incomptus TaxID=1391653 RepID=A0A0K1P806_9BACT|nr:NADH-quinone oxidoreductase subunit NuoF [Vulgatibacter incomptus]AKU89668.1 NADH-ubiquinone oxidoreductase chain F [Vulgatibacter incomptus]
MSQFERVLTKSWAKPGNRSFAGYKANGGYDALPMALKMQPSEIIDTVKASNLRGRGGAGFPTGMKWSFVPKDSPKPKYLCINADESEPGTFKDRLIIEQEPHSLMEGIAIASYALGVHTCYIYIRGEYLEQAEILEKAIAECYEAGIFGKSVLGSGWALDVYVHRGAGAYICGEETALLNSLEGKKGWPRLKPPFPAVVGLFGSPTVVNNVETINTVPTIIKMGAEKYAALGTPKSGGTRLVCVSGHVNKPGVYEIPMTLTFDELIHGKEWCGGIPGGRKVKAVIPGGSSAPVLHHTELDVAAEYEALKAKDNMAGSGAVVVMDDSTCMVRALWRISKFYAEESCGQCTPCREGTPWMERILRKIEEGQGEHKDLALLKSVVNAIAPYPPIGLGTTICALGDAAALPVHSFVDKFREEFEQHINEHRCPFPHPFGILADEGVRS